MNTKPRRILALETSGRIGSVALGDDTHILASEQLPGTMRHAAELIPTIDRLIKERQWRADSITDVFISIGPGSFTGLRIAVSVARTLAWSIGARIVAVPTVDALARNALAAAPPPAHVAVILDAKRQQVYAAAFDINIDTIKTTPLQPSASGLQSRHGTISKIIDAHLADPADFFARCPRPLAVLGEGIDYHRESVANAGVEVLDRALWPGRAENVFSVGLELAALGKFTPGQDLMPLYIRRPEVEEKWEKLHGTT